MATGTGKTVVAFQICWKLWNAALEPRRASTAGRASSTSPTATSWSTTRRTKIFAPFGDARCKIESGEVGQEPRDVLRDLPGASPRTSAGPASTASTRRDFFDLIIVDECHRGSARDESNWREILEYFEPAYQLGMTATPLREDNRDTYRYFGNPLYTYSLRQGIDDGFLAPYRVHRVVTDVGRRRLAAEQGRARPLRPRDPRRRVPAPRTSSASSRCARAPRPSPRT